MMLEKKSTFISVKKTVFGNLRTQFCLVNQGI